MAIDRVNAVYLGKGKDAHGYQVDVLRARDGTIMHAYELEVWEEKCRHHRQIELERQREAVAGKAKHTAPSGTPRNSWPATLGHHKSRKEEV